MEIVQHKDLLVVVYEAHTEVRHIYLANRAKEGDLFPDRNGYSFGRWDGDKLDGRDHASEGGRRPGALPT